MRNLLKYYLLSVMGLLPLSLEAASYRWIDEKGTTHYTGTMPASDAQRGHVELGKSAIKKKVVISAKKNRENKELVELREQQRKLAANKKKEDDRVEEMDIRLLSLYSSEDEIVSAYNSKLRRSQLTIDLLKSRHKKQSNRLTLLERKQEQSKVIKHKHTLGIQIDETLDSLSIYQQAITENLVEKDRVRKEFKNTLNYFKKLIAKVDLSK